MSAIILYGTYAPLKMRLFTDYQDGVMDWWEKLWYYCV